MNNYYTLLKSTNPPFFTVLRLSVRFPPVATRLELHHTAALRVVGHADVAPATDVGEVRAIQEADLGTTWSSVIGEG